MNNNSLIVALFLFLSGVCNVYAGTFHVDRNHPSASDSNAGTVKNVHFINNTVVDAGLANYGGGFRVNHERATGIVFRNNIAWNNDDYDVRGEAETLIENNLCTEAFCEVQEDPEFIDPLNDDYRLQSTSPAIDRGLLQDAPALDIAGHDLGAYEFYPEPDTEPGQDSSQCL